MRFTCVVALMIFMMVPDGTQALREEERERSMKLNIELGLLAIEPPQHDDTKFDIEPRIQISEAEEDRDHLHHPRDESLMRIQQSSKLRIPPRNIFPEAEENRDHLHHP
ncbi:hypothetical protein GDO86_013049 [Hymenochirus boettgeri]|uniref:Uncharacterized protein n=1 Tax=Hymenochirus boettgeri TaxID=247094 RepID=A0A8T2ITP8_9PIPI|nr:hypothetical protein GDO86_013049 [Hymenochirus boettgeri]